MAETPHSIIRVPLDRYPNPGGQSLNRGMNHQDIPIVIDPDLPLRGERQNTYDGSSRIVLREWDEQVLLHELLHVALLHVHSRVATEDDPHGHDIVSRIEVALWETGWRLTRDVEP